MVKALLQILLIIAIAFYISIVPALCLRLDRSLKRSLSHGETANILVSFSRGTETALHSIDFGRLKSRSQRISKIADTLRRNAEASQINLLNLLQSEHFHYESLWISNQVFIRHASWDLIKKLMLLDEVEQIVKDKVFELDAAAPLHSANINNFSQQAAGSNDVEWNIHSVDAPTAWAAGYSGQGVIVASIDSGVLGTHEALRDNYVGSHGWYDPYTESLQPTDENGHGTHTMGTLAGRGGIGVAPGSKWMACKGCFYDICSQAHLIKCGQFLLCPTLPDFTAPDCSKAPHVINCSWGGGRNNQQYHPVIEAWRAAGIISVFSNGNTGPECSTSRSPADYPYVIGVGAIDEDGSLEEYSGLGPTLNGTVKPDFVAPGTAILSSYNSGDDKYAVLRGTSMAAPHVTGIIAILKSRNPDLPFEEVKHYLIQGANRGLNLPGKNCGGVSELEFPNNAVGYGGVNAYKSLQSLIDGGVNRLQGRSIR